MERKPTGTSVAVVDPDGGQVDYRVLAAELVRAAEYYLTVIQGRHHDADAKVALEQVISRYKAGTLDGLTELRQAVHVALFQLRTIAHKLPPEAKTILRDLAKTLDKYQDVATRGPTGDARGRTR